MPLRLNLGCGRAHLPTTSDNPFTAHQQYALERFMPAAYETKAGWVNVDQEDLPGVQEVVDLFTYPWVRQSNGNPWNDNSVDEIFCSHIVEHIPHVARLGSVVDKHLQQAARLDGWYAFFYEAWRILKPGGHILIVAPYAWSSGAVQDPTHTRYVQPESFSYFAPNPDAPFDYRIPARFESADNPTMVLSSIGQQVAQYSVERDRAGRNENMIEQAELDQIKIRALSAAAHQIDGVTEFAYMLTAIKEGM
jgi:hypothetical protein